MRTLNINAKKTDFINDSGSENFQKCGFSLIFEKGVQTGVPKCGQIRINADE